MNKAENLIQIGVHRGYLVPTPMMEVPSKDAELYWWTRFASKSGLEVKVGVDLNPDKLEVVIDAMERRKKWNGRIVGVGWWKDQEESPESDSEMFFVPLVSQERAIPCFSLPMVDRAQLGKNVRFYLPETPWIFDSGTSSEVLDILYQSVIRQGVLERDFRSWQLLLKQVGDKLPTAVALAIDQGLNHLNKGSNSLNAKLGYRIVHPSSSL